MSTLSTASDLAQKSVHLRVPIGAAVASRAPAPRRRRHGHSPLTEEHSRWKRRSARLARSACCSPRGLHAARQRGDNASVASSPTFCAIRGAPSAEEPRGVARLGSAPARERTIRRAPPRASRQLERRRQRRLEAARRPGVTGGTGGPTGRAARRRRSRRHRDHASMLPEVSPLRQSAPRERRPEPGLARRERPLHRLAIGPGEHQHRAVHVSCAITGSSPRSSKRSVSISSVMPPPRHRRRSGAAAAPESRARRARA